MTVRPHAFIRRALWAPPIVAIVSWTVGAILILLERTGGRIAGLGEIVLLLAFVSFWAMTAYLPFAVVAHRLLRRSTSARTPILLLFTGPAIVTLVLIAEMWAISTLVDSGRVDPVIMLPYAAVALVVGYSVAALIGALWLIRARRERAGMP